MVNNITRTDLDVLIEFLSQPDPRLTQGEKVRTFEREWSAWLGVRMLRSHGLVREASSPQTRQEYHNAYPDLNSDFIFACPAYNVRNTELNTVL